MSYQYSQLKKFKIALVISFFTSLIILLHLIGLKNEFKWKEKHNFQIDYLEPIYEDIYVPPQSERILNFLSRLNISQPGFMGVGVKLENLPEDIETLVKESKEKYNFNEFAANLIPLDRKLPDFRTDECKNKIYSKNILKVSVILSFYNEPFSMLMRTVYSIMMRSPKELIEEILLIDDFSNDITLLENLQKIIPHLKIVRMIRTKSRLGLMKARVFGSKIAKGPILVIMDSHMEVTTGWLPPLLEPHYSDHHIVTMPMVESFNRDTLEYKKVYDGPYNWVGGFTWDLTYTWTQTKMPNRSDIPLETPTMLGCAFVIRKQYFEYLGFYDDELELWGAENLELSFKVSMCGGKMFQCFCSHTAHMFRNRPYWNDEAEIKKIRNTDRVAEVWLDDYKILYKRATDFKNRTFGNVDEQKKIRKNLNCKSFEWFLENKIPQMKVFLDKIKI